MSEAHCQHSSPFLGRQRKRTNRSHIVKLPQCQLVFESCPHPHRQRPFIGIREIKGNLKFSLEHRVCRDPSILIRLSSSFNVLGPEGGEGFGRNAHSTHLALFWKHKKIDEKKRQTPPTLAGLIWNPIKRRRVCYTMQLLAYESLNKC
jgi:hypothetical protein